MKRFLYLLIIPGIILFSGCHNKNKELEKDVAKIGDLMCRAMEVMNKLKAANSGDTISVMQLQKKNEEIQAEIATNYTEFRGKYGAKMMDPTFIKDFKAGLKKAMLDCKYLSNEDREKFMKEME